MESTESARRFVDALNAFDLVGMAAMLTDDFEFQIGPHVSNRDDFLASLATGPGSDPVLTFAVDRVDGTEVHGRQEYHWRETGELASSSARILRLEFGDRLVRRAVVEDTEA